tara:strand:- start:376 stop:492 length:117 start_codon:yes stop_codon:yes gene_type:complete
MKEIIKKIEDKAKSMPNGTVKDKILKDLEKKKLNIITK